MPACWSVRRVVGLLVLEVGTPGVWGMGDGMIVLLLGAGTVHCKLDIMY